jgi:hypothetical protein
LSTSLKAAGVPIVSHVISQLLPHKWNCSFSPPHPIRNDSSAKPVLSAAGGWNPAAPVVTISAITVIANIFSFRVNWNKVTFLFVRLAFGRTKRLQCFVDRHFCDPENEFFVWFCEKQKKTQCLVNNEHCLCENIF